MNNIFIESNIIRAYAQIQENLNNLPPNANNSEISNLIKQIPPDFLTQKDTLMVICQLIAQYARRYVQITKRNIIKLFEQLMDNLKTYLQNESEFFWNIFGGTYYIHLWLHREGLISIDEIIQRIIKQSYPRYTEYFLPEIIDEEPEIFEKEIKDSLQFEYSEESIEKLKKLRSKHFKWISESNDFNDPIYKEIETNQLRYAIKIDDIESFQKIFSNLNMDVNSNIQVSLIENFFLNPNDISLLNFAIIFNSIKIFKYLIMNGASTKSSIFVAIWSRNYEIIHIIESLEKVEFVKKALYFSINASNDEMIEYLLSNFDSYPLEKDEFDDEDEEKIINIIENTVCASNFIFFESTLL